ncbi:MAG: Inorganic triphosphatase [Polaribacter sp. SA4-10]|nr:MAG: Inorganic triphosphatase [Polaribacter sp. SA4-10]|tara:strand:- start:1892 stop:2365 length:474 start_codon:yes stop_codon:yes gene_type:complete
MAVEIERKFLVKNNSFKQESFAEKSMKQGYLNSNKNRTVRIRITDDKAFITVKGNSNSTGVSRFEWEKEIDKLEAEELLLLCETTIIEKNRFYVKSHQHVYEIDEFFGDNYGLIIAEVELKNEDEAYTKPLWLGEEVTGRKKYYNSKLSKNPFKDWN